MNKNDKNTIPSITIRSSACLKRADDFFRVLGKNNQTTPVLIVPSTISLITLAMIAIAIISPNFHYGSDPANHPIQWFYALLTIASLLYLLLFFLVSKLTLKRPLLYVSLLLGLVARVCFFNSTPIYEDDWYRYLWDGVTINSGINPYSFTPASASLVDPFGNIISESQDPDIAKLQEIGAREEFWPERINYPYVTTIYPPVAQSVFTLAAKISPFNLDAWRFVLLIIDFIALSSILLLLRQYNRAAQWSLLYWCNPVLIVTTFNAGHMDVLLVPFLIFAVLAVSRKMPRLAAISLAGGVAVKFWPVILAPILFRQWRNNLRELFIIALIFSISIIALLWPMLSSINPDTSGLFAYANTWQRNAFLFPQLVSIMSIIADDADLIARAASLGLTLVIVAWASILQAADNEKIPHHLFIATLGFYLLSPTGYPWYAIWFLMFLPFYKSAAAAVMTLTLPVYYWRFYLERVGRHDLFENILGHVDKRFQPIFQGGEI